MMKRFSYVLAGVVLAFCLTGCSNVKSVLNRESEERQESREDLKELKEPEAEEEWEEEGGYVEGRMGDRMKTYFFDFTINSAYTCDEFEGYRPSEGKQMLVVQATVKNTFYESIVMFDTDFQAQWNSDGEEDYEFPITDGAEQISDEQLPEEYELGVNEERNGLLVFEVPEDKKDFSVSYLELFDDDSEGDVFFVYFTADQR